MNKDDFRMMAQNIGQLYGIDKIVEESCTWYDLWKRRVALLSADVLVSPAVNANCVF